MFNRIGAIILLVSDMKKSLKFYRDTLGMELKKESEDWIEFVKQGTTVLALHPTKKRKMTKTNSMLVGFNINNLESVCSELEKKEVKFYKKLTEEPFGKHAIIKDPDGHLISLTEIISKEEEEEYTQIPYYHGFAPA
ncbi:MAG TPA: VOC family protein [Nitrososphaeraceae archaeon]|nr:VOC family protein [Nitrososphaeraceae archaeon]